MAIKSSIKINERRGWLRGYHFLGVLFFQCCAFIGISQQIIVKENIYGVEDGLPHREVNTILQDEEGFIWVGTPQGIGRFDGRSFENHNILTDSFLNSNIWRILEDADGWFWLLPIPPFDDFDIWHPKTGERITFKEKFSNLPVPAAHPADWVKSSSDQTLFAGFSDRQLFAYHPLRGAYLINLEEGIKEDQQSAKPAPPPLIAADEYIWLMGKENHLLQVNRSGKVLQDFPHEHTIFYDRSLHSRGFPFLYTEGAFTAKKKAFLVDEQGRQKELRQSYYFPAPVPPEKIPTSDASIVFDNFSFYEDGKEAFFRMSSGKDVPYLDRTPGADLIGIDGSAFRCLYYDARGNLWAGGNFGLHKLSFKKNNFQRYLFTPVSDNKTWRATRSMLRTGNKLLVNQEYSGPVLIDLATGLTTSWVDNPDNFGFTAIAQYAQSSFAVGHFSGVYLFQESGELKNYVFTGFQTWAIYPLSATELLLGTNQGLMVLNTQHLTTEPYSLVGAYPEIDNAQVLHIHQDQRGQLWFGTNKGLFQTNAEGLITARYAREGNTSDWFPTNAIYHFYEEGEKGDHQSFWVGTGGDGLIHLLVDTRKHKIDSYEQYTGANGLPNDVIYAVYPDDFGKLWLSSDKGIIWFDPATKKTGNFQEQDGITNNEFNRISHCQAADGTLYFGGLNGVTSFRPNEMEVGKMFSDPPLKVLSFYQFDGKSGVNQNRTAELIQDQKILLQPKDHSFSLKIALLDYEEAIRHHYAWRLGGLEKDWSFTDNPELRFGRLPYGKYKLQIKGQDARGLWSENILEIPVEVVKPVYLQPGFLLAAFFSGLGLMLFWTHQRTKALKRRQKELETIVATRTKEILADKKVIEKQAQDLQSLERLKSRFFANVSHELRTPLTLLLGPVKSLLRRSSWPEKDQQQLSMIQRNAQQLLKLVNEILDLSKMEDDRLQVAENNVDIVAFVRGVSRQFTFFGKENEVRFIQSYKATEGLLVNIDQEKVEKILNNYLANAFKFTAPGGSVNLTLKEEENTLLIAVADTGIGIHPKDLPHVFDRFYQAKHTKQPAQGGTGIGLSLALELARLMGGRTWVKSTLGEGSIFYLELPKKIATGAVVEGAVRAVEERSSTPTRAAQEKATVVAEEKASILLVEDNEDLRLFISSLLEAEYHLKLARNGAEAWHLLNSGWLPTLILSDLMMPIMDGFQLLEKLKSSGAFRHIPVVMLTARRDAKVKLRALRIGVDDYLLKPFDEEELKLIISNLLANYRLRKSAALLVATNSEEDNARQQEAQINLTIDDQRFLEALEEHTPALLDSPNLNLDYLSTKLFLSRRQLQRKIKALTGLTPNAYLKETRLQRARMLLETRQIQSVKATSLAVGIKDVNYFSRLFRDRFGKLPSELLG